MIWSGYGNLSLLDKPQLHVLQASRSLDADALDALRRNALEWVKSGGVLVAPFISPGDKEIARAALDAGGAIILMKPDGFARFFKPGGRYFDLCLQDKLLNLSCRPPSSTSVPLTRDLCLAMNRWCAEISTREEIPLK